MKTKMNYRRNRNTKKYVVITVSLGVLIAVGALWGGSISKNVTGMVHQAAAPLWRGGDNSAQYAATFFSLLQSKQDLVKENRELKERVSEMRTKEVVAKELRAENNRLKSLLDRSGGRDAIGAVILAHPPQSPYDTLVVDVGREHDVQTGDRVYAHGDISIGEIVAVNKRSSIVELFSTQGRITEVRIGPEAISGSAEGQGGQNFLISLPRDISIEEGAVISAPDIGVSVLGVVSHVAKDENSPFQKILFTSPVHVQNISWVTISRSARVEDDIIEE